MFFCDISESLSHFLNPSRIISTFAVLPHLSLWTEQRIRLKGNTLHTHYNDGLIVWVLLYKPLLPQSMHFLSAFKYREVGAFNTSRTNRGLTAVEINKPPLQEASGPLLSNSIVLIHQRRASKDTRPLGLAKSILFPVRRPAGSSKDPSSVPILLQAGFERYFRSTLNKVRDFTSFSLSNSLPCLPDWRAYANQNR